MINGVNGANVSNATTCGRGRVYDRIKCPATQHTS